MILHTRRSSNRNDGEKVLSCVLLHVIRLSRVAQLIVSRRVAGIRVGLLACCPPRIPFRRGGIHPPLSRHQDPPCPYIKASHPFEIATACIPVSSSTCEEQWLRLTGRKKKTRILRLFSRCFLHLLFDMMRETENIVEYLLGEESVEVRKWN